jgi:hypothetical protein
MLKITPLSATRVRFAVGMNHAAVLFDMNCRNSHATEIADHPHGEFTCSM